ncbi:unnamed protein product [Arctogadus glacialis]
MRRKRGPCSTRVTPAFTSSHPTHTSSPKPRFPPNITIHKISLCCEDVATWGEGEEVREEGGRGEGGDGGMGWEEKEVGGGGWEEKEVGGRGVGGDGGRGQEKNPADLYQNENHRHQYENFARSV